MCSRYEGSGRGRRERGKAQPSVSGGAAGRDGGTPGAHERRQQQRAETRGTCRLNKVTYGDCRLGSLTRRKSRLENLIPLSDFFF